MKAGIYPDEVDLIDIPLQQIFVKMYRNQAAVGVNVINGAVVTL